MIKVYFIFYYIRSDSIWLIYSNNIFNFRNYLLLFLKFIMKFIATLALLATTISAQPGMTEYTDYASGCSMDKECDKESRCCSATKAGETT